MDGETAVDIQELTSSDEQLVAAFLEHVSSSSEYRRFFTSGRAVRSGWSKALTTADQRDHLVHGAFTTQGADTSLVAVAESIRLRGRHDRAEFAAITADPWQGLGIGTMLARRLAAHAAAGGVSHWEAYMLASNDRMKRLLDRIGPRIEGSIEFGLLRVVHRIDEKPSARS